MKTILTWIQREKGIAIIFSLMLFLIVGGYGLLFTFGFNWYSVAGMLFMVIVCSTVASEKKD